MTRRRREIPIRLAIQGLQSESRRILRSLRTRGSLNAEHEHLYQRTVRLEAQVAALKWSIGEPYAMDSPEHDWFETSGGTDPPL